MRSVDCSFTALSECDACVVTAESERVGDSECQVSLDRLVRGIVKITLGIPGVILCEIMAQSCAILVKDEIPGHLTLYAGLDKVRFKNSVKPGDLCEVTARLVERRGQLFFCNAKLEVNGRLCCKGEPSFALVPIEG